VAGLERSCAPDADLEQIVGELLVAVLIEERAFAA
jgi:hypothetical protein